MLPEGRKPQSEQRHEETLTVHRSGEGVETKLCRIAEKARREPAFRFTSLYHLMNRELLRECFEALRKDAASGIDGVTKEQYGYNLEEHLEELIERLHRMAYRPQGVRRVYIPKPGSNKQRPIGIPSLEDKLVQAGLVRILEAIYEEDFTEDSFGFRPGRSAHDALRALSRTVEHEPVNYIVEADIKGFFDNVEHGWLMKFLAHRIGDQRILRLVKRFLKAGVIEEGCLKESETGTPQGGTASPLLANIYLHYVLDLWFRRVYQNNCQGYARLIRYADDFVVCFQSQMEANRFRCLLDERLGKFGLEVEPTKTKVLGFGRYAEGNARAKGEKPATFDFLGFTHYCGKKRDGKGFRMKRITARKRMTVKLKAFKEWMKQARILPTCEIMKTVGAKIRGHFAYYGVTDNTRGIQRYVRAVSRLLYKWLNRRGKRRSLPWERFQLLLKRYPLPRPRIQVGLF